MLTTARCTMSIVDPGALMFPATELADLSDNTGIAQPRSGGLLLRLPFSDKTLLNTCISIYFPNCFLSSLRMTRCRAAQSGWLGMSYTVMSQSRSLIELSSSPAAARRQQRNSPDPHPLTPRRRRTRHTPTRHGLQQSSFLPRSPLPACLPPLANNEGALRNRDLV